MSESLSSTTPPRRQPKQPRSRALVDAIYQACMNIIESGAGDKLSVRLIAETAGITLSSFYQYFPNVQSVVVPTLLKYDQNQERYNEIVRQLTEQALTPNEVIEFIVDAICDRHLRFLHKYGHVYRRYHHFVNAQLCVGFDGEGLAKLVDWEVWLRHFLEVSCRDIKIPPTEMAVFMAATALVELTARATEEQPKFLGDEVFRKAFAKCLSGILFDGLSIQPSLFEM